MSEIYGDRELRYGDNGDDVLELQIKLSGWFSEAEQPRWSGDFDTPTENAVKRFQEAHNLYPSGVVEHWTFKRIGNEVNDHFFNLHAFKCPARGSGCNGFGGNRSSFTGADGRTYTAGVEGVEHPGVNRVLVWLVRGLMHRGNCAYTNIDGGGYRCLQYNSFKRRTSTNHMGNALDIIPYRSDWSRSTRTNLISFPEGSYSARYNDAVTNFIEVCVDAGIPEDIRNDSTIYRELHEPATYGGYYAGTWVHLDVRTALNDDFPGGIPDSMYADNMRDVNAPYYTDQLISSATATPSAGPAAPAPYPGDKVIANIEKQNTNGYNAWQTAVNSYLRDLDNNSSSLGGETDPTQLAVIGELFQSLITDTGGIATAAIPTVLYDAADTMEAVKRAEKMASYTRIDHRNFGKTNNDIVDKLLRIDDATFKRRYELANQKIIDRC